ncbi:MAG: 50S ribosome-binding GTPase [Bacteroidetes bacterium]|nr:50S ribosome-binding GTPase [Bacteroidota bacterium]
MDILRFITAGSVDDGKSTLIGRLLYDSKSILADHLEAIEKSTKNKENGAIDLALLTDGLRAEREQGITIDVAYRYFSTDKRKFIIADAPGHVQYTRNMITGASNVDLAIVLIDARHGVVEQTRRHSIITSLLGIQHIVVAINKIDLVNYSEDVYDNIVIEYSKLAQKLGLQHITYIPMSALNGDNIVEPSVNTPWFDGKPLLEYLETVEIDNVVNLTDSRFQVQYVLRPQTAELHDYRGYAGKITSGIYKKGDTVKVLPAGIETTIDKIEIAGKEVEEAFAPQSVTMLLSDDIDISRGDAIIKAAEAITPTNEAEVLFCWLDDKPLQKGNKYLLQHNTRSVKAVIKNLSYKIDVNTLDHIEEVEQVKLNEIVKASIKTAAPLVFDAYKDNRSNGAAILIDETSNATVAAVLFQ